MMMMTSRCRACSAWLETSDERRAGLCGVCNTLRQVEEALANPRALAAVLASIPGGYDPRKAGHGPDVAHLMADEGHLTPQGLTKLLHLMRSGADAYAYYAIDGRPNVWACGRRWMASEWNGAAAQSASEAVMQP